jgi:HPt (histidine-containing phosphotransfer) domain-containing protein
MTLQTLDQLNKLREELPGVMDEVMQLFVTDAPRQIKQIETAYAENDADALRQWAHYLRSGALALRLEWVAEQAHRLEFLAIDDFGTPASGRLLQNLQTELNAVVVALLQELDKGD